MGSLDEVADETYTIDSTKSEKINEIISFDFQKNEAVVVLTTKGLYKYTNDEPTKPEVIKDPDESF